MKKLILTVAAVAVAFSLSGCGATATFSGTDSRTVELNNGGTVECVIAGGTSGSPAVWCVDDTYIPPTAE